MIYNISLTTPKIHSPTMKPLKRVLKFLTPDACVVCGAEGRSLCSDCSGVLQFPDQCYMCKKPSQAGITCEKCSRSTALRALWVVSVYSGSAKELVTYMKYHPSASSASEMGELMAKRLPFLERSKTVIVPVPTTASRRRERGFDQAAVMAKGVSKITGCRSATVLRRITNSHQVGSGRKARLEHMKDGFRVKSSHLLYGKTVVLVDDVLTTGATLESAAQTVLQAGAKKVVAVVFAIAE
jgi:ComF family protein